ncbi:hypothetical protein ACPA9J_27825 [Pseudomonas aeruginosa]
MNCAAEALVLGDPAQLRLAHGPRGADGRPDLGVVGGVGAGLAGAGRAAAAARRAEVQAAPFLLPLRDDASGGRRVGRPSAVAPLAERRCGPSLAGAGPR